LATPRNVRVTFLISPVREDRACFDHLMSPDPG